MSSPLVGCPGEVWGGVQTQAGGLKIGRGVGVCGGGRWCGFPRGQIGVQALQGRSDIPVLCVPTVTANVAPMFLPNMTSVALPEDLPVGESPSPGSSLGRVFTPQGLPGAPVGACSSSHSSRTCHRQRGSEESWFQKSALASSALGSRALT